MRQFRSVCFGRFDLIRMFLEIQIQAAFADGSLHPNERAVLYGRRVKRCRIGLLQP